MPVRLNYEVGECYKKRNRPYCVLTLSSYCTLIFQLLPPLCYVCFSLYYVLTFNFGVADVSKVDWNGLLSLYVVFDGQKCHLFIASNVVGTLTFQLPNRRLVHI